MEEGKNGMMDYWSERFLSFFQQHPNFPSSLIANFDFLFFPQLVPGKTSYSDAFPYLGDFFID
jgi:hypothetical protein